MRCEYVWRVASVWFAHAGPAAGVGVAIGILYVTVGLPGQIPLLTVSFDSFRHFEAARPLSRPQYPSVLLRRHHDREWWGRRQGGHVVATVGSLNVSMLIPS
jgi:hypothetical protein